MQTNPNDYDTGASWILQNQGIFALAAIHGIGTGSDTQTSWALGIYLVSIVLVGSLLCRRIFFTKGKRKHVPAHPAMPDRNVIAAPYGDPRTLNGARGVAPHIPEQNRAGVAPWCSLPYLFQGGGKPRCHG